MPDDVPVNAPDVLHEPTITRLRFQWRHRWTVLLVMLACGMTALAYVAAANFVPVELRLPGWQENVRLSWVVIGSGGIGVVVGFVSARLLR